MVPTFTMSRSTGSTSSFAAAASPPPKPQACGDGLLTVVRLRLRSRFPRCFRSARTAARPTSTRLEPVPHLSGFNHWFTLVTPLDLACRARTIWQYWHVPALSGLLPTLPRTSGVRLPSASPDCCDSPERRVLSPAAGYTAPRGARATTWNGSAQRTASGLASATARATARMRRAVHATRASHRLKWESGSHTPES